MVLDPLKLESQMVLSHFSCHDLLFSVKVKALMVHYPSRKIWKAIFKLWWKFYKINYLGFILWDHRTKPLLRRRVTISYQMVHHIYAQRAFLAFVMFDGYWNHCLLTGWSSQCGWWWGKQQGLLCMMRWQSEQITTMPPSSFELPELCMGLPHLWKEERRQQHQ